IETHEEINHVLVALQHDHRVVAAAIDPTAARVRPDVDAASRAFSCRPVSAGHCDFPSHSPQSFRGIVVWFWRPARIMILIAVLFIRLRNDPAGLRLNLSLFEHQRMLGARPILNRRKTKPIRGAVLRFGMRWMAGGEMFVGIPIHQESSGLMRPLLIAEAV